jgi:hypothetical protein
VHDRTGPLGRVDNFMGRAVQDFVVVGFHPDADALIRETRRQRRLLALLRR